MSQYHEIQKGTAALLASGKPYWTIFNPESTKPSTLAFPTEESAWEMAEFMAAREPGSKFYVLAAGGFAATGKAPVERTVLTVKRGTNGGRTPISKRFRVGDRVRGTSVLGSAREGFVDDIDSEDEVTTYRVDGGWMNNKGLKGV